MTLSILQEKLDNLGFETILSDNVLQGSLEIGENLAVEITADSGGEAKIVKKRRENLENRSFKYGKRIVPIVCEKVSTETFRVQLSSADNFIELEKEILKA